MAPEPGMDMELYEKLEDLAEKSGVQGLEEYEEAIRAAAVTGDEKLIDRLQGELTDLAIEDPYPFVQPAAEKIKGPIEYGDELQRGVRAGFQPNDFGQMAITGRNQMGKTNLAKVLLKELIQQGITVHVFDPKESFRGLINQLPDIHVLNLTEDVLWNPFAPPVENERLRKFWRSKVIELINELFDLLSGSGSFSQNAIYQLYKKARDQDVYPTIHDLKDYVEARMEKLRARSIRYNYAERLLTRLEAIISVIGDTLKPQVGFPLQDLAGENLVFEWGNASTRIERFLILSIFLSQYYWRKTRYRKRGTIDQVIIVDEAEALFDPRDDKSFKKGVPFTKILASRSKELGLAIVVINQNPSLSEGIKDNVETWISFAPSEEHTHSVGKEMGLDEEQEAKLTELQTGECIVKMGRYPEPFGVKADLF
ncbi:DUF87 domain-containing protein [Candidatus Bipolaricaulota bacterium]|nr:DUF87 domain-containing protein [Candidatus Bipolaricaulota bacterium]